MKNIVLIINPISGTSSKEKIPSLAAELFSPSSFNLSIVYTEYGGHASALTKEAIDKGAHYIVAVGGDGTVNEVARAMVHSDAALGIIPLGSGNGLARELRVPLDIRKSMEVIAKENVICIDYCKANEHIFFCTCGFGFDASVSERFSGEKNRGSIAYIKSVIKEYVSFRPETYEFAFDEGLVKEKAFLVTFANASQYGNNAFIAPKANIQDGKMDVAVISPINPLEAGPLAIQLFAKQIDKNNKVNYYQTSALTIRREKAGVMHIDGDPVQMGSEIHVQTIASGLKVIAPIEADKQTPMQVQIHDIQSFFREIISWIEDLRPL
ncbi:phosphatidylglycerol kinase [Bacteroidales bacterium]|nr:phosphatidylglycerol kinase [Bacteroidales bacterium]